MCGLFGGWLWGMNERSVDLGEGLGGIMVVILGL